MRKYFFLLATFACLTGGAQNCPGLRFGTKTLYPVPKQGYAPPPQGYQPVFINHVGRHGARHLTKDVAGSFAYQLVHSADSANGLTDEGKKLKQMIVKLEKVEKKDFESISAAGKSEQQGLAKRMTANYPALFSSSPDIKVTVAKKVRTSQSADAFLSGLKETLNTDGIKKTVNDTILRFYDLSPSYASFEKDGAWTKTFNDFKEAKGLRNMAESFSRKFFSGTFLPSLSATDREKFVDDVYGFATITPSIQTEITAAGYTASDLDFFSFFSCPQLQTLNSVGDAEDFLVKGPGTDVSGIQVKIAAPLLTNFINTTDDFIAAKKPSVQLRFSHAETVAPFAALLGIHGAATPVKKLADVSTTWPASAIVPLSANIQWILYGKGSGNDYLVKFLLNEKEVAIDGLSTKNFPYYKWAEVRSFYVARLQSLQTTLADNGYQYLLRVK